jgi:hypothetical protein
MHLQSGSGIVGMFLRDIAIRNMLKRNKEKFKDFLQVGCSEQNEVRDHNATPKDSFWDTTSKRRLLVGRLLPG